MGEPKQENVGSFPISNGQQTGPLTPHQKDILDYAATAAMAANKAQTEELVPRVKHAVQNEINAAFETYTKQSIGRKVVMGLAAVAAFGLGFLTKGWVSNNRKLPMANGVSEDMSSMRPSR